MRGTGASLQEGAIMARGSYGPAAARLAIAVALVTTALALGACSAWTGQPTATSGVSESLVSPGVPSVAGDSKTTSSDYGVANGAASAPEPSRTGASTASVEKLVVVNKTMRIETAKVDEAIAKIRELVARDGAEIQSMQVSTAVDQPIYREPVPLSDGSSSQSSSGPLRAYVTVRVPSDKYPAFIADAAKLGTVLTESETADDVTQQHVDMKARLGNLTAEQGRLRQLFAKATSVKDMLAIEQELTRVQGDIESMQAQIDYLERQASMATVTLELSEPKAIVAPAGIDWGVQNAFTDSIRAFVGTMNVLIVILGPVLALLLFVGVPAALVVWLILRAVKRRRTRRATAVEPETAEAPPAPMTDDEPPIL
jgi:hypothetical protein